MKNAIILTVSFICYFMLNSKAIAQSDSTRIINNKEPDKEYRDNSIPVSLPNINDSIRFVSPKTLDQIAENLLRKIKSGNELSGSEDKDVIRLMNTLLWSDYDSSIKILDKCPYIFQLENEFEVRYKNVLLYEKYTVDTEHGVSTNFKELEIQYSSRHPSFDLRYKIDSDSLSLTVQQQPVINVYIDSDLSKYFKKIDFKARYFYNHSERLVDSLPNGKYIFYNVEQKDSSSRKKQILVIGQYLNGFKHGQFSTFNYMNGRLTGKYSCNYFDGLKNGVERIYSSRDKKLECIEYSEYKSGLLSGMQLIFNQGKIEKIYIYDDGKIIKDSNLNY